MPSTHRVSTKSFLCTSRLRDLLTSRSHLLRLFGHDFLIVPKRGIGYVPRRISWTELYRTNTSTRSSPRAVHEGRQHLSAGGGVHIAPALLQDSSSLTASRLVPAHSLNVGGFHQLLATITSIKQDPPSAVWHHLLYNANLVHMTNFQTRFTGQLLRLLELKV